MCDGPERTREDGGGVVVGVWDLGMLGNKWYGAGVDVWQVEGLWLVEMVEMREVVVVVVQGRWVLLCDLRVCRCFFSSHNHPPLVAPPTTSKAIGDV